MYRVYINGYTLTFFSYAEFQCALRTYYRLTTGGQQLYNFERLQGVSDDDC